MSRAQCAGAQRAASFVRRAGSRAGTPWIPWSCVVTNPVNEGFGMPHFEKSTVIEPWTSIAVAVRSMGYDRYLRIRAARDSAARQRGTRYE